MSENPYAAPSAESAPQKPNTWLRWLINLSIGFGVIVVGLALLLPNVRRAGPSAYKLQCMGNIRSIAIALRNYETAYQALPPAYTVDQDGKPLHSWRTLILPFLDERRVYKKIDLSKAWDDPVNAEAYNTNLDVFHCHLADCPQSHTTYLAVVGIGSCFHPTKPRFLSEITDDHAETLMVIEVSPDKAVHWMAPADADEQTVLGLGPKSKLSHASGVNAVFVDGSARFLSVNMDPLVRHALISIDASDSVTAGRK